jgi:Fic family protein
MNVRQRLLVPVPSGRRPSRPEVAVLLPTQPERTTGELGERVQLCRRQSPDEFDHTGDCESEAEPSVRAALGHRLFGYIHPYMEGNGRMARVPMNAVLASGGYPWTVVRVEDRTRYLHALDSASTDLDIEPFAAFLAERVEWSVSQAQQKLRG